MAEEKKYLYGPVPSRRMGRSLGIDIVPFKVCTLDCVYCQLGGTTQKTLQRGDFIPVEAVLAELKDKLAEGLEADFITIGGSGEPTLNCRLGELVDGIKKITNIPVAILTNGTLLNRLDVRADCAKADVVLPSLDAGDEKSFQRINRPHPELNIEELISGLCTFRKGFTGLIWLEVFIIEGFNTDNEQIAKIRDAINRIRPDKVQLNTAVRPTAEPDIRSLDAEKLQAIAEKLGENCEVIADFALPQQDGHFEVKAEDVLSMLKRRPCSLSDICSALGMSRNEALKCIAFLQQQGVIDSEKKGGITFFKAN
ncbi:MAG: radical SAM protein [Phycisphaerae bacterium]|jgi:wyosine [tRNA(Phe)-imidazoG37] synthetase (radical SAM superfamily)